jgi:hypothetical protein
MPKVTLGAITVSVEKSLAGDLASSKNERLMIDLGCVTSREDCVGATAAALDVIGAGLVFPAPLPLTEEPTVPRSVACCEKETTGTAKLNTAAIFNPIFNFLKPAKSFFIELLLSSLINNNHLIVGV